MTTEASETRQVDEAGADERPARPGRARMCVGCGERAAVPDASLVRLILGPAGEVAIDPGDGGFGRGAHVHARPSCLARAAASGLARAAKGRVLLRRIPGRTPLSRVRAPGPDGAAEEPAALTAASLGEAIADTYARRADALIGSAVRARLCYVGSDAVTNACRQGVAKLVVVAADAAAAADLAEVRHAIAAGGAVCWGTKASLGALCRSPSEQGVATLAIESSKLAVAVRDAVMVVLAARDAVAGVPSGASAPRPPRQRAGKPAEMRRPVQGRPKIHKQSRTERGS